MSDEWMNEWINEWMNGKFTLTSNHELTNENQQISLKPDTKLNIDIYDESISNTLRAWCNAIVIWHTPWEKSNLNRLKWTASNKIPAMRKGAGSEITLYQKQNKIKMKILYRFEKKKDFPCCISFCLVLFKRIPIDKQRDRQLLMVWYLKKTIYTPSPLLILMNCRPTSNWWS